MSYRGSRRRRRRRAASNLARVNISGGGRQRALSLEQLPIPCARARARCGERAGERAGGPAGGRAPFAYA